MASVYVDLPLVSVAAATGGATSANQVLEITALDSIDSKTPALVGGKVPVVTSAQSQTATFVEDQTVSSTPETFTAPTGAFAALIETDETNSVNLRVVMDGSVPASSTSGIQFQPGRSELYEGGSNISYCSESSSAQKISVQWFIRT